MKETDDDIIPDDVWGVCDFDWFAYDVDGNILYFTSALGRLPSSVAQSWKDNETLERYFWSLPILSEEVEVNPHIRKHYFYLFKSVLEVSIREFKKMSQRGLFSFDRKGNSTAYDPGDYYLVSRPTIPLKLHDLPTEIVAILQRTKFQHSVKDIDVLNIADIT